MGENATIYDVLRAYLTKHCNDRFFFRRARPGERHLTQKKYRGKHAVRNMVLVHPIGRTKSDKSLIPMWAAFVAELYE